MIVGPSRVAWGSTAVGLSSSSPCLVACCMSPQEHIPICRVSIKKLALLYVLHTRALFAVDGIASRVLDFLKSLQKSRRVTNRNSHSHFGSMLRMPSIAADIEENLDADGQAESCDLSN